MRDFKKGFYGMILFFCILLALLTALFLGAFDAAPAQPVNIAVCNLLRAA